METKKCNKCGRELPLEMFSARKVSPDGLQPRCKVCDAEYHAKRRAKAAEGGNPDLAAFTPRQLIEELRSRGYKGKLTYTYEINV